MDYSLFSSAGNLIDSFDSEDAARSALQQIVANEPDAVDDVAMFVSDDDGTVIEGPIYAVAVPVS